MLCIKPLAQFLNVLKHSVIVSSHNVIIDYYGYLCPSYNIIMPHLFLLCTFESHHYVPHHASVFTWSMIFQEMNFWFIFSYLKQTSMFEGTWKTIKGFIDILVHSEISVCLCISLFWRQYETTGLLWVLVGVTTSNHFTFQRLGFPIWALGIITRLAYRVILCVLGGGRYEIICRKYGRNSNVLPPNSPSSPSHLWFNYIYIM